MNRDFQLNMSAYYSLPRVRLKRKEDEKKLNNFSNAYLTDDIKNFLVATNDYGQEIQSNLDLYITRGKHNEASFRRKLDRIKKNVWRKENPLELLHKDISNFDAQNPVIASLLREIDVDKRDTSSNF